MEAASDKKPKVIIGCDHAAYDMKEEVKNHVISLGYEVEDIGTNSADDKVDYPLYGKAVAEKVVKDPENLRGILLCGTGIGISISANKVKGAICGLCHDYYTAVMCREHNNANIVAMGGRVIGMEIAKQIAEAFLTTEFKSDHPNHPRRVKQLLEIGNEEN